MRRPIVPCACALALVTGVWFGQAYTLFIPSEPIEAVDTADQGMTAAAWRYYDAINVLFRTGDNTLLRKVISPAFVDHVDTPGALANRDEFLGHLSALRASYPALTVVPRDLIAKDDRAVAQIIVDGGNDGSILGIPYSGPLPWPEVELVRIADDQVVERWGGPVGYALATPLLSQEITVPSHGEIHPYLRRVTFAPGSSDATFSPDGPAMVLVESGTLVVGIVRRGGSPSPVASQRLGTGETVEIPENMEFAVSNAADTPADILVVNLALVEDRAWPQRDARPIAFDERIEIQDLTGTAAVAASIPGGTVAAELAEITLAPGMRLSPHPIEGAHLVFVEEGALSMTANEALFVAWLRDPGGRAVTSGQHSVLTEGYGLSIAGLEDSSDNLLIEYRNVSDHPVTFLLVRLTAS